MSVAGEDPETLALGRNLASTQSSHDSTPTSAPSARPGHRSKLRDSCQSCAKSKVRCTKEKPTCVRCDTRGIQCQYLQSKRPGRIPKNGQRRSISEHKRRSERGSVDLGSNMISPPQSGSSEGTPEYTGATNHSIISAFLTSPHSSAYDGDGGFDNIPSPQSLNHGSLDLSNPAFMNPISDLDNEHNVPFDWDECLVALSAMDDKIYSNLMDWDAGLAGANSLASFNGQTGETILGEGLSLDPTPDLSSHTSYTPTSTSFTTPFSGASSKSSSVVNLVELPKMSSPSIGYNRSQSNMTQTDVPRSVMPNDNAKPACDCTLRSLDLLKVLSEDRLHEQSQTPRASDNYIDSILARNQQDIDTGMAILSCTICTTDKLLLIILHLVTMKILGRYTSVARMCGAPSDSPSTPDSPPEKPTTSREGIQQVLRELHRVQRLITQLSSRLQRLDYQESNTRSTTGLFGTHNRANSDSSTDISNMPISSFVAASMIPLSAHTLSLVEGDLRRSLTTLSANVRGALKNS